MELPLFPLHTVLCPGVALPLHVFEPRYRELVERCLADDGAFGVILIREGREVGPSELAVATVGTAAQIREANRLPGGQFDLVTLGTTRFRLHSVRLGPAPYLVGNVTELGEVLGRADRARQLAERVNRQFVRYVALLGAGDDDEDGPELTFNPEWTDETDGPALDAVWLGASDERTMAEPIEPPETLDPAPSAEGDDRAAEFDQAMRRLSMPDDPTAISYLLSGIVQMEPVRRQILLESDTTEVRLEELTRLLSREIALLEGRLRHFAVDPRALRLRRN
jgi:hypothetical protein